MKIASFNTNNINRRLSNLIDWLRDAEPDIDWRRRPGAASSFRPTRAGGSSTVI
jgi:hypothetical protein